MAMRLYTNNEHYFPGVYIAAETDAARNRDYDKTEPSVCIYANGPPAGGALFFFPTARRGAPVIVFPDTIFTACFRFFFLRFLTVIRSIIIDLSRRDAH